MSKRFQVGNLSFQTTEHGLSTLFKQIGRVDSVKILTDRDTGRSKGFAFVEMAAGTPRKLSRSLMVCPSAAAAATENAAMNRTCRKAAW
jgi:hypothetical protein